MLYKLRFTTVVVLSAAVLSLNPIRSYARVPAESAPKRFLSYSPLPTTLATSTSAGSILEQMLVVLGISIDL